MTLFSTIRSWFGTDPAVPQAPALTPPSALIPDASISALTPTAPSLSVQRYSDENYAVSRALEARKIRALARICEVNNAAAEDVIDRRGTVRRPNIASRAAAPLTAQEQHDAANLAEVTYVMENSHDSWQ